MIVYPIPLFFSENKFFYMKYRLKSNNLWNTILQNHFSWISTGCHKKACECEVFLATITRYLFSEKCCFIKQAWKSFSDYDLAINYKSVKIDKLCTHFAEKDTLYGRKTHFNEKDALYGERHTLWRKMHFTEKNPR